MQDELSVTRMVAAIVVARYTGTNFCIPYRPAGLANDPSLITVAFQRGTALVTIDIPRAWMARLADQFNRAARRVGGAGALHADPEGAAASRECARMVKALIAALDKLQTN